MNRECVQGEALHKPIIGITVGDVAGIGPEIIRKALKDPGVYKVCIPVVIGDLNLRYPKFSPAAGEYAMQCVRDAVSMAMAGNIDAIVTAPICKEGIHAAGYKFEGHTDYLAFLTDTKEYSMMFVSPQIKVVLVTIHIRLRDVVKKITQKEVLRAIKHAFIGARLLGIKKPKVAVCALNPHGEEVGDEERIIKLVVEKTRAEGPFSADTIYLKKEYDVFVAMYHDQGLIPVKILNFQEAVNVTLGLPFIRTSPDHGTAYDIAGKNKANPTSMIRAIELAAKMAHEKKKMSSATAN